MEVDGGGLVRSRWTGPPVHVFEGGLPGGRCAGPGGGIEREEMGRPAACRCGWGCIADGSNTRRGSAPGNHTHLDRWKARDLQSNAPDDSQQPDIRGRSWRLQLSVSRRGTRDISARYLADVLGRDRIARTDCIRGDPLLGALARLASLAPDAGFLSAGAMGRARRTRDVDSPRTRGFALLEERYERRVLDVGGPDHHLPPHRHPSRI